MLLRERLRAFIAPHPVPPLLWPGRPWPIIQGARILWEALLARTGVQLGARSEAGGPAAPRRHGSDFVGALEEKSRTIQDPVAKLRYIRSALARYQEADRKLQAVPSPLRALIYKATRFDRVQPLLTTNPNGGSVTPTKAAPPPPARVGLPAAGLLAVGALLATAYQATRPVAAEPPSHGAGAAVPTVAESLPALPVGVAPSRIWLVEKGEGWELYSNGLRVDSTYATSGDPRRFRIFDARRGMQEAPTTGRWGSSSTPRKATSGRSRRASTRSFATAARACSATSGA